MIKRLMATAMLVGLCASVEASLQPYSPVPKTVNQATYLSFNAGPYFRDMQQKTPLGTVFSAVAETESWHQENAGYQAGLSAGWQIVPHFSLESTWTWYENQTVSVASVMDGKDAAYLNNDYEQEAWSLDFAAVGFYHVMKGTDLFLKAGAAYIQSTLSSNLYDTSDASTESGHERYGYWAPMFGAGVRFFFSENWYGLIQYTLYLGGGSDVIEESEYTSDDVTRYTKLALPLTQRASLSVGYQIEL